MAAVVLDPKSARSGKRLAVRRINHLALTSGLDALEGYHLFHAARADLLRRLERRAEAAAAYRRALDLTANDAEIRYLERRLLEVS